MKNYKKKKFFLGALLFGILFFSTNTFTHAKSCGVSYENVKHTIPITDNGIAKYYLEETIPTTLSFTVKGEDASLQNYIDVVLVMDRSGSMSWGFQGIQKLDYAKQAMKNFVDTVAKEKNLKNRIGLVSFSSSTTLDHSLSNDYVTIKSRIDSLYANGWTSVGGGLLIGANHLKQQVKSDAKQFIILASDGEHNTNPSVQAGISTVSNETTVYTIGIGNDSDEKTLKTIAETSGTKKGKYFFAEIDELNAIFEEIIKEIRPPFEMKDVIVEFPVDETHALVSETRPPYQVKVPNLFKWTELGSMQKNQTKDIELDYRATSPVSGGSLSGGFIKVSYTLFERACSDIVPFVKESVTIVKPRLVFKSSPNCTGVVSPFMSEGDKKEITLCNADTSKPVKDATWNMADETCVWLIPGGDETRKIEAMKTDCTTNLTGKKFPYSEANLFLGVFNRVNPPIPLPEQNIFREVTP